MQTQIKKMRISHDLILDWLILNPEKTQNECAEFFGVTPAWLSVIVNSDCFQARWLERRLRSDERISSLIESKMRGVANKGLERLEKMMETVPDPEFVLQTTDKLLARLGYGIKGTPHITVNAQQNNFAVSRDVLEQAKNTILNAPPATLPAPSTPLPSDSDT